ncbi:ABC transporter ATP-binding protein [Brevundimonas sp.]|uniref:ABC transporter ATP-binding protein n=1 Tax=Brevundimonas sp. TaxID=1871086 RepID=UPI001DACDAC4|nr:ABC transporter ATP-binding protein [Brevundimonas sp.]MBL0947337.1 ABC transporter ATP-binding protein [Brevundimonas sp.]
MEKSVAFARDLARYIGGRAPGLIILVALGALLEGFGLVLLVPLLGTLFADTTTLTGPLGVLLNLWPEVQGAPRLVLVLALFGMVTGLRALVLWQRDLRMGQLQVGYLESKRSTLARALANSRWEALNALGHGRVTHLMGGDIQRCASGVYFLLQGGVAVVLLVIQAGVAVALAPVLALFALISLTLGALVMGRWLGATREIGARVTSSNMRLMVELGRFLGGLKAAMSQNLHSAFVAAFERDLDVATRQQVAFINRQAAMRVMWSLLGAAVASVSLLLGFLVLDYPPAVMLTLLVVLARIAGPAIQIQSGLQQVAYALPAWEAVQETLDELGREARIAVDDSPDAGALQGPVRLQDVTYLHEGATDGRGVRALSLTLRSGEFVAVTGMSGAGKTTFADLLAGLLEPQQGCIRVGDHTLDARTVSTWRDRLAYVTQDPLLFNDTIRANLLWGGVEADEARIEQALALTGADRVVSRLSLGLDSVVGEDGAMVSGGERQRLALSRALLRRPDVLVLDEATAALDTDSEDAVLKALAELDPRPLILMISHRSDSLSVCSRRLTFDEGRLVDDRQL